MRDVSGGLHNVRVYRVNQAAIFAPLGELMHYFLFVAKMHRRVHQIALFAH